MSDTTPQPSSPTEPSVGAPAAGGSDSPTQRTQLKRLPERGLYDTETVHRLIDEIGLGSVAYAIDGKPRLTPTMFWREGNALYWHGSTASHAMRDLAKGIECCANIYAADGLVLARSGLHSSVNYRSVTIYGTAEPLTHEADKLASMERFIDRYIPGRWADLRPAQTKELKASMVLRMEITEASAKIRTGPPEDDEEDYALPIWAGVVPIKTTIGAPIDDPRLTPGIEAPAYLSDIRLG